MLNLLFFYFFNYYNAVERYLFFLYVSIFIKHLNLRVDNNNNKPFHIFMGLFVSKNAT